MLLKGKDVENGEEKTIKKYQDMLYKWIEAQALPKAESEISDLFKGNQKQLKKQRRQLRNNQRRTSKL